jgi:hypothetical protein
METFAQWCFRREDGEVFPKDGDAIGSTSWDRLESVRITNISVSAFGVGLQLCDSAEF